MVEKIVVEVSKETVKETIKEIAKETAKEVGNSVSDVADGIVKTEGLAEVAETDSALMAAETSSVGETASLDMSKECAEVKQHLSEIVDMIQNFEFDSNEFFNNLDYALNKIDEVSNLIKDLNGKITDIAESDYVANSMESLNELKALFNEVTPENIQSYLEKINDLLESVQSSGSETEETEDFEDFGDGE